MLAHVASTTCVLVAVVLFSKAASAVENPEKRRAKEMMSLCLHWREASRQDMDVVLRLQHAATAAAYLEAAKMLATVTEIEQSVGMDVSKLERSLEKSVKEAKAVLSSRRGGTKE